MRKSGIVAAALWVLGVLVYQAWNFRHYDPLWGFDGPAHLALITEYARAHALPVTTGHRASNPPVYYIVAALVYRLCGSMKAVQLFSMMLFISNVALMARALWSATASWYVRWGALTFFTLFPLQLEYSYMTFNYSLGNAVAIGELFLLITVVQRGSATTKECVVIATLTAIGILTSLSNFFLLPLALTTVSLPAARMNARQGLAAGALVLILAAAMVYPYYSFKASTYGCFFCTKNRTPAKKSAWETYPAAFYYSFDPRGFQEPYYPHHLHGGMWNLLYETAFGDYFEYLVPERLSSSAPRLPGMTRVGLHFIDAARAAKLTLLNELALPIAALFVWLLASATYGFRAGLAGLRSISTREDVFVAAACGLCFAQFLIYIVRYPDYVNISAGYLFPCFFVLCWYAARRLRSLALPASVCFFVYGIFSAGTFWLR